MINVEIRTSINDFFSGYIEKARPRKRIIRDRRRQLAIYGKVMLPPAREWMKLQQETIQKGLPQLRGRKAGPMVERLCNWKALEEEALVIIKTPLLEVLNAAGKRVVEGRILKQEVYDPLSPMAVNWAAEHGATLVTEVTEKTQAAIRSYVSKGLQDGVNARTIAMKLRPLVGLTEKDLWAVANYEEWLIVNRPEYSAKKIKEMAEVYARRKHRARAELISRTETAKALDAGTLQGYDQMGVKKVDRIEDPECCDECLEIMEGGPYTLKEAEAFDFHPDCEGSWVMA